MNREIDISKITEGLRPVKTPWAELYFSDPWFREHAYEYEKEIWNHVTCPKGGVAVDVGAHQGFYTTKLAKEAGEAGLILAFEPDAMNYEILLVNLELNDSKKNVVTYQKALSDHLGEGVLYTYNDRTPKNSGKHFVRGSNQYEPFYAEYVKNEKPICAPQWETKVSVTFLDHPDFQEMLLPRGRCDLIKIDTEGAELRVLKGAQKTLGRFNPKVVLEVHYNMLDELNTFLNSLGYVLLDSGKLTGSDNPYAVFEKCKYEGTLADEGDHTKAKGS
jgi:FkbM family methyltransferase